MTDEEHVPVHIRLIRDFVNTYEPQVDRESLSTGALAVREGLRNVLLGHAGHEPDPETISAFRAVLADLPVRLDFETADFRLVSTRDDAVGRALGQLLDAVRQTSQDGTWPRLKVCAPDTCRWAFYDASRNQVRRWCSMAGCGNHVKMRRASATGKARADASATAASRVSEAS